jgi:hypothetical protein
VGLAHVEMAPHQGEHPTQNNSIKLLTVSINQMTTGALIFRFRPEDPAYDTDRPVLKRLGHRGNGMVAHQFQGHPPARGNSSQHRQSASD